jgi:hypothetical protein
LQVLNKVVQETLRLIEGHRAHQHVETALLQSVVRMLRELGIYTSHFERPFLDEAAAAYTAEGVELTDAPVATHLERAEARLKEEAIRCKCSSSDF